MKSTAINIPAFCALTVTAGVDAGCTIWLLNSSHTRNSPTAVAVGATETVPPVSYSRMVSMDDAGNGLASYSIGFPASDTFTKSQVFNPDSDVSAIVAKRHAADSTAHIFQVQSEAAAALAYFDYKGGLHLPTADPLIAGAWWDNAGTLTKSTGV